MRNLVKTPFLGIAEPGTPVTPEFDAEISGQAEVELEGRHLLLVELRVAG